MKDITLILFLIMVNFQAYSQDFYVSYHWRNNAGELNLSWATGETHHDIDTVQGIKKLVADMEKTLKTDIVIITYIKKLKSESQLDVKKTIISPSKPI